MDSVKPKVKAMVLWMVKATVALCLPELAMLTELRLRLMLLAVACLSN
jgi:hypothetical protein